jgi:hypothetical protein
VFRAIIVNVVDVEEYQVRSTATFAGSAIGINNFFANAKLVFFLVLYAGWVQLGFIVPT